MKKLFGTDGIRGIAGEYPLDASTIASTGASLVRHLIDRRPTGAASARSGYPASSSSASAAEAVGASPGAPASTPPAIRILIGRDTRESGPWIQEAMLSGIARAGGEADPI